MALFLENFEQTEEGKKLNDTIPKDVLDNCRMVYKLDEETNRYVFKAFWDPDETYEEDDVVLPIQSTFDSMKIVYAGTNFANVIGSSADKYKDPEHPNGGLSWIAAMRIKYAGTGYSCADCCTDGFFYDGMGQKIIDRSTGGDKNCGFRDVLGGHVILNSYTPSRLNPNDPVDLLPICTEHNIFKYNSTNPGTNYYMITGRDCLAMHMTNFLRKEKVQSYIESYGMDNITRI